MANISYQQAEITGTVLNFVAASGGGDTIAVGGGSVLLVKNGDVSSKTVTITVPGSTFGQANPDVPITVAAGAIVAIPLEDRDLVDSTDGLIHIAYSAVTNVTVAAISV